MISALSEQLSKQSLEDVNHPFTAPYQTRSKTRAQLHIQCLDDELSAGKTNVFDAPSVTVNDISPGDRPRSRSHTVGSSAYSIPQNSATASHVTTEDALSVTPPTAPPKKRHCRSMSAGEVTERNRGRGWKPRASKVWRPLHTRSKPDGHQGHSPLSKTACFNYHRLSSHIPSSKNAGVTSTNISEYSTPPDSPVPRPVSATSWDGTVSASAPPFWLERFNTMFRPVISPRTMHNFSSLDDRDRMSESSGSVTSVSSSRSDSLHDMELRNQKVVQRCKSQPCVPVSKRGAKKRRREEEARPKLDFYKMEEARFKAEEMWKEIGKGDGVTLRSRATRSQAVMCKKTSLRSAGRKCNPEEFLGLQTIASSPGETNNNLVSQSLRPISPESESNASSSVMITPTCSPTRDMASKDEPGCSRHRNVSKDDGYHGDSDCDLEDDEEDDLFPCTDLDLDAIEKH